MNVHHHTNWEALWVYMSSKTLWVYVYAGEHAFLSVPFSILLIVEPYGCMCMQVNMPVPFSILLIVKPYGCICMQVNMIIAFLSIPYVVYPLPQIIYFITLLLL